MPRTRRDRRDARGRSDLPRLPRPAPPSGDLISPAVGERVSPSLLRRAVIFETVRTDRLPAWIAVVFGLLAFAHAALWGQIVPLWQIPDEAAHFEYAHLLTRLGRRPTPQDADPALQAQMLRSMWENRYWEYLGFARPEQPPTRVLPGGWTAGGAIPDTMVVGDAYIGAFSQLQNPTPVYYTLLAPVQAAVLDRPIDDQLRALRWASRVIFALGVMFIVLAAGEVFAWRALPVLATGAFVVLQPMFNYIGSGVNNDNGVMMFASAALWQLARGWRRGYPWWRIALIVGLVALAVQSKRAAAFLAPWAALVIGSRWFVHLDASARRRLTRIGAGVTLVSLVGASVAYFVPTGTPVNWVASSARPAWSSAEALDGGRSFILANDAAGQPITLRPYAPARAPLATHQGKTLEWTVWVKGEPGSRARFWIEDNDGRVSEVIAAGDPSWKQIVVSHTLTATSYAFRLNLASASREPLYADALALALDGAPIAIPNASAEEPKRLLAEAIVAVGRILGVESHAERLLREYRGNLTALPERVAPAVRVFASTYWGRFGIFARAPNPRLPDALNYALLGVLGVVALAGAASAFGRSADEGHMRLFIALLSLGVFAAVAQAFLPLTIFAQAANWLPQGRYIFGAMGLTALLVGWGVARLPFARLRVAVFAAMVLGLGGLSVWAWSACWSFFALV